MAVAAVDPGDVDVRSGGKRLVVFGVGDLDDHLGPHVGRGGGEQTARRGQPGLIGDQELPVQVLGRVVERVGVVQADHVTGCRALGPGRGDAAVVHDEVDVQFNPAAVAPDVPHRVRTQGRLGRALGPVPAAVGGGQRQAHLAPVLAVGEEHPQVLVADPGRGETGQVLAPQGDAHHAGGQPPGGDHLSAIDLVVHGGISQAG